MSNCLLYLISPPLIEIGAFKQKLEKVLETGVVSVFQLRLKDVGDEKIVEAGLALKEICHKNNVQFILNDRADLAKKIDADGVHLGQNDGAYENAREILGDDKIIGVSCYNSLDRAMEFGDKGANYVAFGAFYPTDTKQDASKADIDILNIWSESSDVPCVAIGGIDTENCKNLIDSGADFIAVISSVWNNPYGEVATVNKFNEILNND